MWQRIITKPGGWLHAHPWTVVAFLAGIVAGIGVAKLVAGFPSADAIASILGAGIGSAMAVLGAVWVANREERNRRSKLLSTLASITELTVTKATTLLGMLAEAKRDNDAVRVLLEEAHGIALMNQVTLLNMQPLFARDVSENLAYLQVMGDYATLLKELEKIIREVGTTANRMYIASWDRTDFPGLDKATKSLKENTRFVL